MAKRIVLVLMFAMVLTGRAGGSDSSSSVLAATGSASGTVSTSPSTAAASLILSGTPSASATVGALYTYRPTLTSSNVAVTFAVAALPSWASFDAASGTLSGTDLTGYFRAS